MSVEDSFSQAGHTGPALLEVNLFGGVTVTDTRHDTSLPLPDASRELLACLCVFAADRPIRRERLAELMWPDSDGTASRKRLRTALWRLRQALGARHAGAFAQDASQVWLCPAVVGTPLHSRFERTIVTLCAEPARTMERCRFDALVRALDQARAPLLEGFDADWALTERERFADLVATGLGHQMDWYRLQEDHDQTIATARRLLRHDPYREDIHAMLIGLYAAMGQPRKAVRQLNTCRGALQQDLGLSISEAEETLRAALKAAHPVLVDGAIASQGRNATEVPSADLHQMLVRMERDVQSLAAQIASLRRSVGAASGRRDDAR